MNIRRESFTPMNFIKRLFRNRICYMCVAIALAAFAGGCGHSHSDHDGEHSAHPAEAGETHGEGHGDDIVMKHEAVGKAGLVFETVEPGAFREAVKAGGVIERARGAERVVVAPASGIVTFSGNIVAGSTVSAGQTLFHISSKGLEQADATATVRVEHEQAERELKRAEELVKEDLISRAEYERIKANYERALAGTQSVAARSQGGVSAAAPIGGFLADVMVTSGQFVNMGDPLAIVAAERRLVVRADVSERQRAFVPTVSGANIAIGGEPVSLEGRNLRVLTSGAVNSGVSHYLPVYLEFDNPGTLGGGTVAEVWLLGAPREDVVTLPKSALTEDGGYYYVYVLEEEEKDHSVFERREVRLGGFDGIRYEILSGVEPGDRVAVEGALKIKMAGMGSAIPGHSHHH